MNTKQQNKLAMYLAVKAVCDSNNSTWQSLAAFADAYTDFTSHVSNIQTLAQSQIQDTSGITQDKKQAKLAMSQSALSVANSVHAYAVKTNNNDLAAKTDFTLSDLSKERDNQSAEDCQNIHDLASTNLAALAGYGVTAATLTALQTAIAAFNTSIGKKTTTSASGKTTTGGLSAEFAAADLALEEELDKLIGQFAAANATFVSDYNNARNIIDLGGGHNGGDNPSSPPPAPPKT